MSEVDGTANMSESRETDILKDMGVSEVSYEVLDQPAFSKILIQLTEDGCSDAYFKSGKKISFKKNNRKFYVSKRSVRADEMALLVDSFAGSGMYTKILNGMTIDQDYRVKDRKSKMVYRLNAGSFDGNRGVSLTIRAVRNVPPTSAEVYLPQAIVNAHLSGKKGLGIFTGDTGSGKSTSAAGLIVDVLTKTDKHLLTIEDPIEMSFDRVAGARTDCTQYQIGKDKVSYEVAIHSALRENPDYIFVGEARSVETMRAALSAAETGHSVLTTLHVGRGFLVFSRIVSMFDPQQQNYIKTRLADMLSYVCFQCLFLATDGKRYALREYLVLDSECRSELLKCHHSELSTVMYSLFERKGQLLSVDIKNKYEEGLLSKESYNALLESFEVDQSEIASVGGDV